MESLMNAEEYIRKQIQRILFEGEEPKKPAAQKPAAQKPAAEKAKPKKKKKSKSYPLKTQ